MFDTIRIRDDFSDASPVYDDNAHLQRRVLAYLAAQAKPLLAENILVLDAGCGTGRLAHELPARRIIPLDISPAMCRAAGHAGPSVNATVTALPFANATFDAVFSSLVLQWVPGWRGALSEMKRVLKPGGVLAVSTLGVRTLSELRESFAGVDRFPHVSPFVTQEDFSAALNTEPETVRSNMLVEHWPDLLTLMRHLKALGARNKLSGRRRTLMTPRQMEAVERRYRDHHGGTQGLTVTWEILCAVMQV